jgi:formyltetrahydrofolate-dependent phosphoribosylglycinamide formyltransferase
MPKRLIVCISGSGSNLQAILDTIAAGQLSAEVALVVSNRRAALGLTRAERAGIPTLYFPLKPYLDAGQPRAAYDEALALRLRAYQPDLVVLAGWLHIFTPAFLHLFPGRVINLHPAQPGAFPGLHAIERAFEAYGRGEITESGCMVHHVIPEVDAGRVIVQEIVPIAPDDTLEIFEARMHAVEHRLIVAALQQFCQTAEDDPQPGALAYETPIIDPQISQITQIG